MSSKHWDDKKGEIEIIAKKLILSDFPILKHAKILYTFRDPPRYDDEGKVVNADMSRLGNHYRDLFGYDFELCVAKEIWDNLRQSTRVRLVYHELCHAYIETDDDLNLVRDNEGRLSTWVLPIEGRMRKRFLIFSTICFLLIVVSSCAEEQIYGEHVEPGAGINN